MLLCLSANRAEGLLEVRPGLFRTGEGLHHLAYPFAARHEVLRKDPCGLGGLRNHPPPIERDAAELLPFRGAINTLLEMQEHLGNLLLLLV